MFKGKNKLKVLFFFLLFVSAYLSYSYATEFTSINVIESVTIEAGESMPKAEEFVENDNVTSFFGQGLSEIDATIPGIYGIEIIVKSKSYQSAIYVVDTTIPLGRGVSHEIMAGEILKAEDFVDGIEDVTTVSISFDEEPDFNAEGTVDVKINLEDTSGNKSSLVTSLTVIKDEEPPVITGVQDQELYVGEGISYKRGVSVIDNIDEDVKLVIDNQSVNPKEAGLYEVIYSAEDSSGNKITTSATITLIEKPSDYISDEEIYEMADLVISEIITEDMTEYETIETVFYWVNRHVTYTGFSDKSDWMLESVRGIRKGTGDCFTYFAVSKLLLERLGFETLDVTRIENSRQAGEHFWNLVSYEGNWYHFDTCWYQTGYPYYCLMKTDSEILEYSKWCIDYYVFDQSLYPATPIQPLTIN